LSKSFNAATFIDRKINAENFFKKATFRPEKPGVFYKIGEVGRKIFLNGKEFPSQRHVQAGRMRRR